MNFINFTRWRGRFSGLLACAMTRRGLLVLAGLFVLGYAISVLWYVQSIPDIGLRTAFTPVVKGAYPRYLPKEGPRPEVGDTIIKVGNRPIETWLDLLWAPITIRDQLD